MTSSKTIPFKTLSIDNLDEPGRYGFGRGYHGLVIEVTCLSTGKLGKRWEQRVRISGKGKNGTAKPKDLGLGTYPEVGLAAALQLAEHNAELAKTGFNPAEQQPGIPTFRHEALKWVNKTGAQEDWSDRTKSIIQRVLADYAFPHVGDMPVNKITYQDLAFLSPLLVNMHPTAVKIASTMRKIFSQCVVDGHITLNPLNDDFRATLPTGNHQTEHHPALPHRLLPKAISAIDKSPAALVYRTALKTIILNGVRPHSAIKAKWPEIQWKDIYTDDDWDDTGWEPVEWDALEGSTKTIAWHIPAENMKRRKPFVIPVTTHLLQILIELRSIRGQSKGAPDLIFPPTQGKHLSRAYLIAILKSFGFPSDTRGKTITLHGTARSTLRTWAKTRSVDKDTAEAALAHDIGTTVENTYMRWDLLEPRARLMQAYADFAMGILPDEWKWIEPEVQARLDEAERRAKEAEQRALGAEQRALQAEQRRAEDKQQLKRLEVELTDMKGMLKAALSLNNTA